MMMIVTCSSCINDDDENNNNSNRPNKYVGLCEKAVTHENVEQTVFFISFILHIDFFSTTSLSLFIPVSHTVIAYSAPFCM